MNPECPTWPGAATAYSRAYLILDRMARNGHVTLAPGSTKRNPRMCVSDEMRGFIDALNRGGEEEIKGLVLERLNMLTPEQIAATGSNAR